MGVEMGDVVAHGKMITKWNGVRGLVFSSVDPKMVNVYWEIEKSLILVTLNGSYGSP